MDPVAFLGRLRRRLRLVLLSDGVGRIVMIVLAVFSVTAVLDWLNDIPAFLRLVVLIVLLAGLGLVLWRRLLRPLGHAMDDQTLARIAERKLPLNGLLFSHLDKIALNDKDNEQLKAELVPANLPRLVAADGAARRMSGAILMSGALVAVALSVSEFPTAVQRFLLPFGSAEWQKQTELAGQLERSVVANDEPLVVVFERLRGPTAAVRLAWEGDNGVSDARTPNSLNSPWREALTLPAGLYDITITTRKASDLELQARVVERPDVVPTRITLVPPAYTGLPSQDLSALTIDAALPGSVLQFAANLDLGPHRDGEQVAALLGDQELMLERDGDAISGKITIMEDLELVIDVVDHYQVTGADGSVTNAIHIAAKPSKRFAISVAEDRRPQARLAGPRRNESVTVKAVVGLEVAASDDIGLAEMDLRYSLIQLDSEAGQVNGEEQVLHAFKNVSGAKETSRDFSVTVGDIASEGQHLGLLAQAVDGNDVTGPGIGRSEPLLLKIVSEEELRQELDRTLTDVRDRLGQSREELAKGLADPEALQDASRSAKAVGRRAAEQLSDVARRWRDNGLDQERGDQLEQADGLVDEQAIPSLDAAGGEGDEALEAARDADKALGEAERIVASMLRSDDLVRELRSLIKRQESLNNESRDFVRKTLLNGMDEAGEAHQQNLVERQSDLAKQLKEWERRVLGSESQHHQEAQEQVKEDQPADRLDQAAQALKNQSAKDQAVGQQAKALSAMKDILDQLKGDNGTGQLAKELGDLAARQEDLEAQLQDGVPPQALKEAQDRLNEDTERLAERLENETDNEEAQKSMKGAQQSQSEASESMGKGQQSKAAREAGSASQQLRDAQKKLEQQQRQDQDQDQEEQDQQEQPENPDVLKLLGTLRDLQVAIVTDATLLHLDLVQKDVKNGGKGRYKDISALTVRRELNPIAEAESEVILLLQEEGIKELEQQPIAKRALMRVEAALNAAYTHLSEPALGDRGVRLTKIALAEIEQLLAIAESMPDPKADEGQQGDGGGGGGGENRQAPFPPRAELALLRAEQQELAWATKSGQPRDLAAGQAELKELLQFLLDNSRPGTRPHLLIERAHRAMASLAQLLGENDRGSITRNEQDLAIATLTQLLEEAQQGGGGGGQSNQQNNKNQNQQQDGQQNKSQADGQGGSEGQGEGQAAGGNAAGGQANGEGGGETEVLIPEAEKGDFLHLPPELRKPLLEAMKDEALSPQAKALLMRYYELLEKND